jgi:hypothetical protein
VTRRDIHEKDELKKLADDPSGSTGGVLFQFDPAKTKALESPAGPKVDAAQEQLIAEMVSITAPALGLEPAACHGLWLRVVLAWEAQHGKRAATITKLSPANRARAAIEMRDQFIVLARELLNSPDQRVALSSATEDAFELYMRKYNKRPR